MNTLEKKIHLLAHLLFEALTEIRINDDKTNDHLIDIMALLEEQFHPNVSRHQV